MLLGHKLVGSGKQKVIVFNDWLTDCTSWQAIEPYLDSETFTFAFTDVRGYGRSLHLRGKHNEKEAAADAFALADHLGWQRFHVIGYSMTGVVIERMVLDAPERIISEIALSACSAGGTPLSEEELTVMKLSVTDDAVLRELMGFTSGGNLSQQWVEFKFNLARSTRAPEVLLDYLKMWTEHDFSAEMKTAQPEIPLLVLAGEWDHPAFRAESMKDTFLAWHPNHELVSIPNCGHCAMFEVPVYLSTLIQYFMKKHAEA